MASEMSQEHAATTSPQEKKNSLMILRMEMHHSQLLIYQDGMAQKN